MIPLKDTNPSGKTPFLTYLLIAANVVVFLYMAMLGREALEDFIGQYAMIPALITRGESLHAFLTSLFLHGSWAHLLGNMLFLNIFGDNIEARLGKLRFLFFYIIFGVSGAFLQFVVNPASRLPNLGASGAIAGVMGAYLCLFPRAKIKVLVPSFIFYRIVTLPAFFMLGYWFLIQALFGLGGLGNVMADLGGVAYFAHIGGFVSGFFIIYFWKKYARG